MNYKSIFFPYCGDENFFLGGGRSCETPHTLIGRARDSFAGQKNAPWLNCSTIFKLFYVINSINQNFVQF